MAALVGANDLLTIPALVGPGERYDEALEWSRQSLGELAPLAEELGVGLALENVWNLALLSPLEFRDFIDSFDSPAVGAYFDVGNVIVTGLGEHWIPLLGDRIRKVHFDNFRGEIGNATGFTRHLLDGAVNWPGIMDALREIDYDGWVIAEITPPAPHYPEKVIYDVSSTMDWILEGGQPAS
jgi:hexulose-6-phosphate isomerase